ncbi:hypothetical protein D9757_001455 [Collybiopsis confluens]|uniref:Choline/carnitine acyltransferase domain-containing protein n=1 Tax=Collybiopsis confluens TaxID=2823264 RepID=A0A8H5HZJ9_9AGAR|nr:hypothetical protein D9757_001455 [Collybiopsis confluens]
MTPTPNALSRHHILCLQNRFNRFHSYPSWARVMLKSILHEKLPTSRFQKARMTHNNATVLPRLPVPDLHKTLAKYLETLRPLLLEEAARGGAPYEAGFALRRRWADEFASGLGQLCQERLHDLDRNSPRNWLDDNFWLRSYLQWRAPLLVNSNWWLVFNDDQLHPAEQNALSGFSSWQIQRAAWLAHRTLQFKDKLASQELHPVTTRTGVWFQESVSKMFNLSRIPQVSCDILSPLSSPSDPLSYNVIVIARNWFYTLRAYDPSPEHTSAWNLISAETFISRLNAIVRDVNTRIPGPEIGVLSADSRDTWASNLQHLISISPKNLATHETIVKSLICLCLDSETHALPSPPSSSLSQPSTISQASLDSHLHAIRSVSSNVANRFFDKPFSVIVDPAGRAGAMGEHSPCDALIPSIVGEYAVVQEAEVNASLVEPPSDEGWSRLDWVTDDQVVDAIRTARARAEAIIRNSDDSMLWFEEYGTDWIKNTGFSPDAYIQMAMQLAWYRTMGTFTATYETALTRMFDKGRTETIRTLSVESRAFVLGMNDPHSSVPMKINLLRLAIQKHTSLTRDAATGRGIDRHLLGLRNMLLPGERCEIFDDPLFTQSQDWRLSTSGLSAGHHFRGTGFGAAYEDGYGINYLAAPSMVKFGIETKFSGVGTSTERFKGSIVNALREMKDMVSRGLEYDRTNNNDDGPVPARL